MKTKPKLDMDKIARVLGAERRGEGERFATSLRSPRANVEPPSAPPARLPAEGLTEPADGLEGARRELADLFADMDRGNARVTTNEDFARRVAAAAAKYRDR